jgi:hypothetical protein
MKPKNETAITNEAIAETINSPDKSAADLIEALRAELDVVKAEREDLNKRANEAEAKIAEAEKEKLASLTAVKVLAYKNVIAFAIKSLIDGNESITERSVGERTLKIASKYNKRLVADGTPPADFTSFFIPFVIEVALGLGYIKAVKIGEYAKA